MDSCPVPAFFTVRLHPGLGNVRDFDEYQLPVPQGYLSEDQPHAARDISTRRATVKCSPRVTNDVDTVSQTLNQSLSQVITSVTTVDWRSGNDVYDQLADDPGCSGDGAGVVRLSSVWWLANRQKYFKQQQDYLGHINGHVEEMYGSHACHESFQRRSQQRRPV